MTIRNVALLGRSGSGKDTAALGLMATYGHVRVAFADPVRRMALAVDPIIWAAPYDEQRVDYMHLSDVVAAHGWDTAKRNFPEVRRFLQQLGTDGVRDVAGVDTWVNIAHRVVRAAWLDHRPVVLTDVRFPNEVQYARRYGFRLIWIDRPGVTSGGHASETAVGPGDADAIVYNGGTPGDLAARVGAAMGS